jgi:hypothetical protein
MKTVLLPVGYGIMPIRPRIVCPDGFSISSQANEYAYCEPRESGLDEETYTHVECGFPSTSDISEDLKKYAEDNSDYTSTVYAYVPVEIVKAELERHGVIFN